MTQAVPEQRPQLPGFSKWLAPQVGAVKKKQRPGARAGHSFLMQYKTMQSAPGDCAASPSSCTWPAFFGQFA